MEKKNIDWGNIGFGYIQTDYRYVSNYKNGAWDEGGLTQDANIVLNECAGVLQYAQTVFEGLKAYTTSDGRTVVFRPDLNESKRSLRSTLRKWRNTLSSSIYVRIESGYRRKAGFRISVPYICNTGRTLLQGRCQADYHPCL